MLVPDLPSMIATMEDSYTGIAIYIKHVKAGICIVSRDHQMETQVGITYQLG